LIFFFFFMWSVFFFSAYELASLANREETCEIMRRGKARQRKHQKFEKE
jgi:hypothetical protein